MIKARRRTKRDTKSNEQKIKKKQKLKIILSWHWCVDLFGERRNFYTLSMMALAHIVHDTLTLNHLSCPARIFFHLQQLHQLVLKIHCEQYEARAEHLIQRIK